jgi:hypothetical protein
VQYVGSLSSTARLYATGSYVHKYFPQGTSLALTGPYTDETTSASGSYQKQIPDRAMLFAVGGSLSRLRGRVDGMAYSLNSSLTWKVGKMDLTAGVTAYQSSTDVPNATSNDRAHQYYYFNLRRTFF